MRIYRLVESQFFRPANTFDGVGAYSAGSRWCSIGRYMSFASSTESLAALEYIVHLDSKRLQSGVVLVIAEIGDALVEKLDRSTLPSGWDHSPRAFATQRIGDEWLANMSAPALRVPSVLVGSEDNVLINPLHPDAQRITVVSVDPWKLDLRLTR